MEKTVFFGPFFGELGWEFAYWHGWVKKICREKYQSYRKIAASYPGRGPFYPDADEFWPHPPEISKLKISHRGYITDCWIGNLPKADNQTDIDGNISQYAEELLNKYKEILPNDTIFYVPHKLNAYYLDGKQYFIGTLFVKGLSFYKRPKVFSALFEHQIFENLAPTKKGNEFLNKFINPNQKIITVFPRHRVARRPDKSWGVENWNELIDWLQKKYPKHCVYLLGAPGGCYYNDGIVPLGCIDLINLPKEMSSMRFDIHLAILKKSDLAIGSLSGAMRVVHGVGCPSVEWGPPVDIKNVKEQNCWAPFLDRRYIFWPEMNPSVEKVKELVDLMMTGREKEIVYPKIKKKDKKAEKPLSYKGIFIWELPPRVFREVLARPFLWRLKKKKLPEGVINNFFLIQ